MSDDYQYDLPFDEPFAAGENPALWSPREIWVKMNQRNLTAFVEDRRVDYKSARRINLDSLAVWYSMFSNTPEGGVLVFGVEDNRDVTGCNDTPNNVLNDIEKCHTIRAPLAKPEFRRVQVIINGSENFCLVIYVPYIEKLVETNKGDAYSRYGDSKHKMSEEEKRDFRATRQQLSFESEVASYSFPNEFNLRIIQDFCDAFRSKEDRAEWNNNEILLDRHLLRKIDGDLKPTNALVLLAANDPRKTIPGCRVRVQRFGGTKEGVGSDYNPLRDRFIEGNVVQIIEGATAVIDDLLYDVTWLNHDGKFVTTPEYPKWAWFEALVNACVHRSYSFSGSEVTLKVFADRMEIESPGGFVPPVNETTIYETRASRNPHFMEALRILGYVRIAREGTRRIRESMNKHRLPDPVWRQEAVHGVLVRVILKNDLEARKRTTDADVARFFGVDLWRKLQEHEVQIAAYAFNNKSINVSEAQRLTGRTWQTSKKDLNRLTRMGILEYVPGEYTRDPKAHYRLRIPEIDDLSGNSD